MSVGEWAKAFAAAQAAMPSIPKASKADMGTYSYKYADLGDILAAVIPVLSRFGLSVAQSPVSVDGRVGVETRVYHEGGHVEVFGPLLLPGGNTAQASGSAVTYARRYSLTAALGITADEDDDGARASQPPPDLRPYIREQMAVFADWDEDTRRDVWVAHSEKVLGGKPGSRGEVDRVVASVREQYEEREL